MVVAQSNTLMLVTVGIERDEWGWLWGWQQIAPLVKLWFADIDGSHLLAVIGDDIATFIAKGKAFHFLGHLQHVVSLLHLVANHGCK